MPAHKLSDQITGRIFGQYLTMDRAGWLDLFHSLKPDTDLAACVRRIMEYDADDVVTDEQGRPESIASACYPRP